MIARGQPHRGGLRARALEGIGHARDRHRAVETRFQGRRPFHPEQILAATLERDLAHRVVHVAIARLEIEAYVAVGELESAVVHRGSGRHGAVERHLAAQVEQPERAERPSHAPPLHGAHRLPGLGLDPRVGGQRGLPSGDPRRRLPQQAGSAGRDRNLEAARGRLDQLVDLR